MGFWPTLWSSVFAITLIVYLGVVIVVSLGGWNDIQSMLKSLNQDDSDLE